MQRKTFDGGLTTTDEHQDHYPWPCVPHNPDIPCRDAQAAFKLGRRLTPQPRRLPNDPAR